MMGLGNRDPRRVPEPGHTKSLPAMEQSYGTVCQRKLAQRKHCTGQRERGLRHEKEKVCTAGRIHGARARVENHFRTRGAGTGAVRVEVF